MPRRAGTGDWIALLILTVLWGSAFFLNELALRALSPSTLVFGRIALGAAVLLVYLFAFNARLPDTLSGWLSIAVMAFLGLVLPFHLTAWAQLSIDSSTSGVLMAAVPLFVLTLGHFLIPGARLTAPRILGFVSGFIGVLCVIGPDALSGLAENAELMGALAILGAALSYAVNTIYVRRAGTGDPVAMSAGMLILASAMTLPGAASSNLALPVSMTSVLAAAILGLLSTGFASVLYFRLVQGPGPAFVSLVNYLVPGWAVLIGALYLDETLAPTAWLGLALILAGVAMSELGPSIRRTLPALRPTPWRRARTATEDA